MALSSLLICQPAYRGLFSRGVSGADPGVRRLQGWIEEAWGNGYDADGRRQLKGKVLGTRKWIGTSDLYAMFSFKGIPCKLYDFPKPKDGAKGPRSAHIALQEWVKAYFVRIFLKPARRYCADGRGAAGRRRALVTSYVHFSLDEIYEIGVRRHDAHRPKWTRNGRGCPTIKAIPFDSSGESAIRILFPHGEDVLVID